MGDVVIMGGVTKLDIPVDRVIGAASTSNLKECVIVGTDQEGHLYFASSNADGGDILWLLEKAKHALMNV